MDKYRKLYNQFHYRYIDASNLKTKNESLHSKLFIDILIDKKQLEDYKQKVAKQEELINSLDTANLNIINQKDKFKANIPFDIVLSILLGIVSSIIMASKLDITIIEFIISAFINFTTILGFGTGMGYIHYLLKAKQSKKIIKEYNYEKESEELTNLRRKYNQKERKLKNKELELADISKKLEDLKSLMSYLTTIKTKILDSEEIAIQKLGEEISTKKLNEEYLNDRTIDRIISRKRKKKKSGGANE